MARVQNTYSDSMLMISFYVNATGEFLLGCPHGLPKTFTELQTSVNVIPIRPTHKRPFAFVITAKARHVKLVTKINHNIGSDIKYKISKPISAIVVVLRMSVNIGNY